MTKVEKSGDDCLDCGTELFFYNPAQVYGCPDCEVAWSMERIEDWSDDSQMPPKQYEYNEYFS